jgi:hypothetical protein
MAAKARFAIVALVGSLALAGAPEAFADPIPLAPDDGGEFTARVGQIAFQASTAVSPDPGRMIFYVSRANGVGSDGVLSSPIDDFLAGPQGAPPVYQGGPGPDTNWPNKPGIYYWQAVYNNCGFADPNCFSPIRSLTIDPLPPPAQTSPDDDASIPYGGHRAFSIQDVPSYTHEGTRLYLEFSKSTDLSPDGTFANRYYLVRPSSSEGDVYEYRLGAPLSNHPGTYYWMVERFDCFAEPDCDVTDGQIRSFTVAPPVAGAAPNTRLTRHPPRRTRKRRARFAFASTMRGSHFQCFYTGGWRACRSPERFRHLKPGRYRFKVRAVANGKRDRTPASWLFKVVRRHSGRR